MLKRYSKNLGLRVAGTIFGFVAVIHMLRIITHADVEIACWKLPLWINWLGLFATAMLSVWMWRLSFGEK